MSIEELEDCISKVPSPPNVLNTLLAGNAKGRFVVKHSV